MHLLTFLRHAINTVAFARLICRLTILNILIIKISQDFKFSRNENRIVVFVIFPFPLIFELSDVKVDDVNAIQ